MSVTSTATSSTEEISIATLSSGSLSTSSQGRPSNVEAMNSSGAFGIFDLLDSEWARVAPSALARRTLRSWARVDPRFSGFRDLHDVVEMSHNRSRSAEAHAMQQALLQFADDTLAHRLMLQCLVPGLLATTSYYVGLLKGRGQATCITDEVGQDVVAIAYEEIRRFGGRGLDYPAVHILDAVRCRVRRLALRTAKTNDVLLAPDLVDRFEECAIADRRHVAVDAELDESTVTLASVLAEARRLGLLTTTAREVIMRTVVLEESLERVAEDLGSNREALKRMRTRARQRLIEGAPLLELAS